MNILHLNQNQFSDTINIYNNVYKPLIKFPNEAKYNAQKAESFLASNGILVRGMKVYGLSNYLRISIGNEEENIKFINKLKIFLEN